MRYIYTIILLLFFFNPLRADDKGQERAIYEEAVEEYRDNNFTGSLDLFEKLIQAGYSSFNLYYNTGNAAFKTGDIPAAILNYEKALLLKPFSEDARHNLEIARTYTVDKLEDIPEIFFIRWFRLFSLLMSTNSWALLSIISFGLALALATVFLFSAIYRMKKYTFTVSVVLMVVSILTFVLSLTNRSLTRNNDEAIVFEPQVTGTSSPGTGGRELFVIHEGTKVEIGEKLGDWYEIKLSDGTVGWIPTDFVKKIIP